MRQGIAIHVNRADRLRLAAVVHVWRATIIFAAAEGHGTAAIGRRAGVPRPSVRLVEEHNRDPRPFVWTADPDRIVEKVRRGYQPSARTARAAGRVNRPGGQAMATARVERRLAAILAADVVGYSPAHGAGRGRHAGRLKALCARS